MKKTTVALMIFLSALNGNVLAQGIPISHTEVVEAKSKTKDELYKSVLSWISSYYVNPKEVIQINDPDVGLIICNGRSEYSYQGMAYKCYEGWVSHTIKFEFKEGKYRITFSNFTHEITPGNSTSCELGLLTESEQYTNKGMSKKYHNNVWSDLKIRVRNQITSVIESVNSSTSETSW